MRAVRVLTAIVLCLLAMAPSAAAQTVDVSVDRDSVSTRLGDDFSFSTRITNQSGETLTDRVAHLNVVGLSSGIYVDPEDWSEERTKSVPSLAPRESTTIQWSVTAVTGGHAAIYVVVLPKDPGLAKPVTSPAVDVRIADTKDLNSDGVLPLALGVPALLGLLTLVTRRRRRR